MDNLPEQMSLRQCNSEIRLLPEQAVQAVARRGYSSFDGQAGLFLYPQQVGNSRPAKLVRARQVPW
jgi:hypothetical protein